MTTIIYTFFALAFLVPLTFTTVTSELFEFNKMIVVYFATIIISASWAFEIIKSKKIIFKKTFLDIPILLFIATQLISTLISIDFRTSLLGYYSRFHGGFLSYLSYAILYWAFVTFVRKNNALQFIKLLITSSLIAVVYAFFEHFGHSFSCLFVTGSFDVECWVQDVQLRVYGTFGQPNWLAAWIVTVIPLTWLLIIKTKDNLFKYSYMFLYFLFLLVLHYTKSRSGILGFGFSYLIFWPLAFYLFRKSIKKIYKIFLLITVYLLLVTVAVTTPWQPKVNIVNAQETVLEHGGTESADIRKIVWQGSFDLFKKYPIFGSGVETFAHSYYQTRPVTHNTVSEWNFLYNKAHNEYLNFLATSGLLGFIAYMGLIISIVYIFIKKINIENSALLAGYASILVTNFFGFSTVPVAFLFFLLPAISFTLNDDKSIPSTGHRKFNNKQKILVSILLLATGYLLLATIQYWRADLFYAKHNKSKTSNNYEKALEYLEKSESLQPNEALYKYDLADIYSTYAVYFQEENPKQSEVFASQASLKISEARQLSPYNVKQLKLLLNTYDDLSKVNDEYLADQFKLIEHLIKLAPTDAGVFYRLSVFYAKIGEIEKATETLIKTIEMKPNYKIARQLLGYIYEDMGENQKAIKQYEYILKNIDPNDTQLKETLKMLQ